MSSLQSQYNKWSGAGSSTSATVKKGLLHALESTEVCQMHGHLQHIAMAGTPTSSTVVFFVSLAV